MIYRLLSNHYYDYGTSSLKNPVLIPTDCKYVFVKYLAVLIWYDANNHFVPLQLYTDYVNIITAIGTAPIPVKHIGGVTLLLIEGASNNY